MSNFTVLQRMTLITPENSIKHVFLFNAGMRFSTLQIKAAIVEIVRNFEITVNARTPDPLIVMPENYLYLPVHNIFLDYKPL